MTDPTEPSGSRAVHQYSAGSANLPTVIFAPTNEPSVTRGVTGVFVPIFLGVFIILAIYFFAGAWEDSQRLARQQAVTRDVAGLMAYIEDLERQNIQLCQRIGDLPERVERPNIQVQLQSARQAFDVQCQHGERLQARLAPGESDARCVTVSPPGRSELGVVRDARGVERRETVSEFRTRICRTYLTSAR